jgi:ABC-type polar amino acid transport system ATPase subunit
LKGIDTHIAKGTVVCIIAPSGGGGGAPGKAPPALPEQVEEPNLPVKIYIEGTDITDPKTDINKVRTEIGMVIPAFNLFSYERLG